MYQHFQETTASINTVDNGGSRHIAKMCKTPNAHRILVVTSWKAVTWYTRWEDNINKDISETGYEAGIWIKLVEEYVQCSALILTMLNLLQSVTMSVLLPKTWKYYSINNSAS